MTTQRRTAHIGTVSHRGSHSGFIAGITTGRAAGCTTSTASEEHVLSTHIAHSSLSTDVDWQAEDADVY